MNKFTEWTWAEYEEKMRYMLCNLYTLNPMSVKELIQLIFLDQSATILQPLPRHLKKIAITKKIRK